MIEAKTIVIAKSVCKNHEWYYRSTQTQSFDRETRESKYSDVTLYRMDWFMSTVAIEYINEFISPEVAEILRKAAK